MSEAFIGRRTSVGVGVESTRGTAVAPSYWFRHLTLDFSQKTTAIQNESAMGRVEKYNDSAVVQQWSEGNLEGKVTDVGVGYLLYAAFGAVSSAAKSGDATVYEHTFTVGQTQTPPSLTIARKDPNSDRRHALGTVGNLELSVESGDWVKINAALIGLKGVAATNTVAFIEENEFTSRNLKVKLADDETALATADYIKCKSFKITLNNNAAKYDAVTGGLDPANIYTGAYELSGEMTLVYDSTDWEQKYYNNTPQVMEALIENDQVTIGTASHPSLKFSAPQVKVTEWSLSNDLDNIIEQTLSFSIELSVADGKAIEAVLTNTKANYNS